MKMLGLKNKTKKTPKERPQAKVARLTPVLRYDDIGGEQPESRRLDLSRPLLLGRTGVAVPRGHESLWQISDEQMSGRHALITCRGDGYEIEDAGSTNGVRVDGEPVPRAPLRDGCLIELGQTLFCFRLSDRYLDDAVEDPEIRGILPTRTANPRFALELRKLRRVAWSEAPVLILGETGVGKDVAARAVHGAGRRASGPFVEAILAQSKPELIESDLFGHLRGSFTGALHDREGWIAQACGGTLFLNEIGTLAPELQARLLGVVETKRLLPIGGREPRMIDVRWISATNAQIEEPGSNFRLDLLYRLRSVRIEIPPLRERKEDLGYLARHFLLDQPGPVAMTHEAARALYCSSIPGNVRGLGNLLRGAALLAGGQAITRQLLLDQERALEAQALPSAASPVPPERFRDCAPDAAAGDGLSPSRRTIDGDELQRLLARHEGNVSEVAKQLTRPGENAESVRRWVNRKLKEMRTNPVIVRRASQDR